MTLNRKIKYHIVRLLRLKSDTKSISLGFTLGFFPNWFPTFGLGPIISVSVAKLFKVNIISALIGGVTGAILWPLLFLLNYKVGNLLLNISANITEIDEEELEAINLFYYKTKTIGVEFLSGAIFNSILFSIILYLFIYIILKKYRSIILQWVSCKKFKKRTPINFKD